MKIGELSRRSGISVKTLRFYAEEGLLASQRSESNYREFEADSLPVLERIRLYRELGLSLAEVRQLLDFEADPVGSCSEVCRLMQHRLASVRLQRQRLQTLENELSRLLELCPGNGPCAILGEIRAGSTS